MKLTSIMANYARTIKSCTLNTGTILDLATGNFLPGKDGHMILNGGVFIANGVTGRPQTFKSSVSLGYFTRALRNYKASSGLCYETEMTLPNADRVVKLSGQDSDPDLKSRFEFYDRTELGLEELFEVIKTIAHEKDRQKKELVRETPFINDHGELVKSWVPTIIAIDSFSGASSAKEVSLYEDNKLGDSKVNMVAMNDGKLKTEFARQMPMLCGARGIYLISTAHIGDQSNLDPYSAPSKDLPMMRAKDSLKRVGTQYAFLAPTMIETRKVELLQDKDKKCLYPTEKFNSDMELQKITAFITRCKNNISGSSFEHISSQFNGIQEWLEFYNLIKESKSSLLEGTQTQKLSILDTEFTRKTIRKHIDESYEFRRALEILGHFVFVRNRWNLPQVKNMGYAQFTKLFNASKELKAELLNSTSIWSFVGEETERPYMSILDIIERITNNK